MIMLVIVIFACGFHILGSLCESAPIFEGGVLQKPKPSGVTGSLAAGGLALIALIASAVMA